MENARVRRLHERHGEVFHRRVYTEEELARCLARRDPVPCLAARFAAKEAVAKALGTGIGEHAAFKEIEVVALPGGRPGVRLHGAAAETAKARGVRDIQLSLTHTEHYAAAMVVLTREET